MFDFLIRVDEVHMNRCIPIHMDFLDFLAKKTVFDIIKILELKSFRRSEAKYEQHE